MKKSKDLYPYICKQCGDVLHVFEPIFMKNYYMYIGMSEEKFIKSINKMMDDSSKLKVQGHSGRFAVIKVNNLPIGIIWASKETLMHECLHATRWALDGAGLFLTSDSEECYAYYQNFLFKCASLYKGVKK